MPIDNETLQRLRDNDSTLTELSLSGNEISVAGAELLGEALQKNTTLTTLSLMYNYIGKAGAEALGQALRKNTALTSLRLDYSHIGDGGAEALGQALQKNTTLTTLNLYGNQISDVGAKSLIQALQKNNTLTTLNLLRNQISDALDKQIQSLISRNRQYIKELQARANEQLGLGRILLYKAVIREEGESILSLPLKLREKVIKSLGENALMTEEQQRLILDYAGGRKNERGEKIIPPVADKLSFFKATKCNRVMKHIEDDSESEEIPSPFKRARLD